MKSDVWKNIIDLFCEIKKIGNKLSLAAPLEFVTGNIIRRCLYHIRQICKKQNIMLPQSFDYKIQTKNEKGFNYPTSLNQIIDPKKIFEEEDLEIKPIQSTIKPEIEIALSSQRKLHQYYLKNFIIELYNEIEGMREEIYSKAEKYIIPNEIIMTFYYSSTILSLFQQARKRGEFEVYVAETAPSYSGHKTAQELIKAVISTTIIPDTAIFAMMSRVHKVIVGTAAVMADGGLVNVAGAFPLALAAHLNSIPFIVCCGTFKLTPLYSFNGETHNELASPEYVLKDKSFQNIDSKIPVYEYVPPDLVKVLITNEGELTPSYIYRLLSEMYSKEDYNLI